MGYLEERILHLFKLCGGGRGVSGWGIFLKCLPLFIDFISPFHGPLPDGAITILAGQRKPRQQSRSRLFFVPSLLVLRGAGGATWAAI